MEKNKENIKNKIVEVLAKENRPMSIRTISGALVVEGIKISQPVVVKYLKELEKEKKIVEEKTTEKK